MLILINLLILLNQFWSKYKNYNFIEEVYFMFYMKDKFTTHYIFQNVFSGRE